MERKGEKGSEEDDYFNMPNDDTAFKITFVHESTNKESHLTLIIFGTSWIFT